MPKDQLRITTSDQYPLDTLLFTPTQASKGVILICPGLGIPKEVYEQYGQFLSEQNYTALVFDYRGIHNNMPKDFPAFEINLRNWGIKDIPSMLHWIKHKYPNQKCYLFGHSVGGQIAGLVENHHLVDRFVFFCSTAGHWSLFNFPLNIFTWFMWYLHIPITTTLLGHMPKSLTYRGVSMAKGVAIEWAAWSRKKGYIADLFGKTIPKQFYETIHQKIDLISFTDDPITTDRAVLSMMTFYKNAPITYHKIDPTKRGLPRIGHSGFFSKKAGKELWRFPLDLIES